MIGGFFNNREEMPMQDFSYTIMKLQSLFHRQLLKGLEGSGLSTGQPKVLAFLNSHEGLAQKEIARACQLEPGSVTVLLKRMEQQGMVERRVRDGDKRNRCVFLTPLGRELAGKVVARFYEVEGAVDEGLVAQAVLHDQLAGVDERGQLLCRDEARFPLRYSNVSFMLPVR